MKPLSLLAAVGLLSFAGAVSASSFIGTTDAIGSSLVNTIEGTSDATSSVGNNKVVLDARADAASFVASNGEMRGAHQEAALLYIRDQLPTLEANDMQLAEAILARCSVCCLRASGLPVTGWGQPLSFSACPPRLTCVCRQMTRS